MNEIYNKMFQKVQMQKYEKFNKNIENNNQKLNTFIDKYDSIFKKKNDIHNKKNIKIISNLRKEIREFDDNNLNLHKKLEINNKVKNSNFYENFGDDYKNDNKEKKKNYFKNKNSKCNNIISNFFNKKSRKILEFMNDEENYQNEKKKK